MSTGYANAPDLLTGAKEDNGLIIGNLKPKFKPIDLSKTKSEFDFKEEIDKAATAAKNNTLKIREILPDTHFRKSGLIDADIMMLQQARELIEKKKYAEALEKIESFLEKQPKHPEAIYIKALCLISIDEGMESLAPQINALSALTMINGEGIEKSLLDLIGLLKKRICGQVYIKFPLLVILNPGNALASISSLVKYDPYCPDYYAFKAIVLNGARRFFEAYECIKEGIRISGNTVSRLLTGLKNSTEAQMLYFSMIPAIKLFKNGQYDQARKELLGVEDFIKGMEEYQLFDKYMRKLAGGGFLGMFGGRKNAHDVRIDGTKEQREKLQLIIVREELNGFYAAIGKQDFANGEKILQRAFQYTPDLPLVCFLLAGCRFRIFNDRFFAGKLGNIDTVIKDLNEIKKYASVASNDPRYPDAKNLLGEITAATSFIEQISVQVRKRQEEILQVNALIKEFGDIMAVAKKGISSNKIFDTLLSRMKNLKKSSIKVKPKIVSPDSVKTLNDLIKAIDINLEQMESIGPINELNARFKALMDGVKGGIKTKKQLNHLESDLEKLKKDIATCETRMTSDFARSSLKQIADVVNKSLEQLEQAKKSATKSAMSSGGNSTVNEHAENLKLVINMIDALKSGGLLKSRQQLETFRSIVSNYRDEAGSAKSGVYGDARSAMSHIISQYDSIISQIDEIL